MKKSALILISLLFVFAAGCDGAKSVDTDTQPPIEYIQPDVRKPRRRHKIAPPAHTPRKSETNPPK